MLRGEYSVTVGGKERHFKLCTLSDNLFCQFENIKLSEYVERVKNPQGFTQVNMIYSQALAFARINKQTIDFTIEDVTVWIDEIGENAFADKMLQIAEIQTGKNLTAPQETGQDGSGKM